MAKKRYSSPKYDQFFYRGDNLSEARKNWNKEMERLLNRAGDWVRKFHAVADIPTKPDRATKSAIQRLKEMVWKNLDEPTRKQYRKEYEYRYENKMPEIYKPKPPYKPPSEKDFINNIPDVPQTASQPPEESDEGPDEDGYRETLVSRDEIEAWIDANINSITVDREVDGMKDTLGRLVLEAADAYGDYEGYLNYLEEKAAQLTATAEKAIKYKRKGSSGYEEESTTVSEFATILNLGRPLSAHESERLENEGWVGFDFND